ncbi:Post-translational flagellin modification protein B [Dissostichus eleginoides]|uniref:Post-translational flagellin modification protein B n=1 Tax=Dissostichus eleginoides TaxID=100907 RepID=A0AAD9C7U1_DISEL|nr:Post-translational flagellin modification protein B [Dissostichus eleginoides]
MDLSDEYLALDMALRFGGSGFYFYDVHFASQAAGRIKQFNQGTYWGALGSELYYRIFASCASLSASYGRRQAWKANSYQGGSMVCNNFNDLGCSLSSCHLMHVLSL